MEKILITGTGRCGTTFLIKLFSFLGYNTGFTKDNYKKFIFENCNSGMEKNYYDNFYIIKNPNFIKQIKEIIENDKIKKIIIPIRNYKSSALSRLKYNNNPGGLINATDEKSQIEYYKDIISNYIYYMTKYDIDTIFIDFDKMISDKIYLFNKLKDILNENNIDINYFNKIYDEVSITSKNK